MSNTPRIGAVVLAGGNIPATLTHLCDHRALLQLNGRYLLEYLLEALQTVPAIAGITVVAPREALPPLAHLQGRLIAAGDSIVENMRRGADGLRDQHVSHLLFITGDIPLITREALEAYIKDSLESGADLTYPIIPKAACQQRFPDARRTYVRLHEDTFTGGNAIFTTADLLNNKHELIQSLYNARKDPFKLAKILGMGTVLRMLSGTLTLPYIETVASRILGAPAQAIISPYAEIGFDVDKLEDLTVVEKAIRG